MLDPDFVLSISSIGRRPGLELVSVEDAALPMAWVSVDLLIQESKPYPLVEEFVIRLLSDGLSSEGEITSILGIDIDLVRSSVADLMVAGIVSRSASSDGTLRLRLTDSGEFASRELAEISPKEVTQAYAFDLLVRQITAYPRSWLISSREVRQRGLRRIPIEDDVVRKDDISVRALNSLTRSRANMVASRVDVLNVLRVRQRANLYLPLKILIFADETCSEIQVGVSVEGEPSRQHELALAGLGGVRAFDVSVKASPDAQRTEEFADLAAARAQRDVVEPLLIRISAAEEAAADLSDDLANDARSADTALRELGVRFVSQMECRDIVRQASETFTEYLLIQGNTLRGGVVDDELLSHLERGLRQGAVVKIAYNRVGERAADRAAARRLDEIARRSDGRLQHGKEPVLTHGGVVWDRHVALAPFDWLGFRGGKERVIYKCDGTLVTDTNKVKEILERLVVASDDD